MVVGLKKRKDLNKEQKNIERMTEWFKVADCKSVRFFLNIGSNPISFRP